MLFQLCPDKNHPGEWVWVSTEKGELRFLWFHLLQKVLWPGYRTGKVYTDIKIANNTKINHIMISFTDYYNVISIDRFLSKTKIRKDSWYFNNSLLCGPEFSPATNTFFLILKTQKRRGVSSPNAVIH